MSDLRQGIKRMLGRYPQLDRLAKLYLFRKRAHSTGHPDWSAMLAADGEAWRDALQAGSGGPRVLLATNAGGYFTGTSLESLLGVSLTMRKAEVHVSLCDAALPACMLAHTGYFPDTSEFARHGPRDLCRSCFAPANAMFRSLEFPVHRIGDQLTAQDRELAASLAATTPAEAISDFRLEGLEVGEHAMAGTLRFFARADLDGEPHGGAILRRYFQAALITALGTRRLVRANGYSVAVFHHGIYVPQGIVGEVCRQEGVRVVTWNPAYRKQSFVFSHGDTYHHTLMMEPTSAWDHLDWSPEMEGDILAYLKSRWQGTDDWIWFHERPQVDVGSIAAEVGVDFSRPCIGLLTNVMWDAQLHYDTNAFPSMLAWVLQTIKYFAGRPELQLLIRVHPAEIRGTLPSRQPVVAEIRRAYPVLPANVFLVPPESQISTYAAMLQCDSVIIFGTKTGVELTSMGIPVVVAGEAWIRNKGVTLDATSVPDYFRILDQLPLDCRMDAALIERSRRYAYHWFFRRMIPLEFAEPASGDPPFRIRVERLADVAPGRSGGLDTICDGILHGSDFTYPAERLRQRA
jgi:hypothetical protein